MSTEESEADVTVDPSSVRSLINRTLLAGVVAALASMPKVANERCHRVDRRKRKKLRKEEVDESVR